MSKYIIIPKNKQAQDQKYLLFYLQKLNPAIEIQAALVVTVPEALDCLIQSLDGVPMAGPAPAASAVSVTVSAGSIDAKALATGLQPAGDGIATFTDKVSGELRKRKKPARRPATTMICSQCHQEREPTKSGICKPCAMANAKAAKKNGKKAIQAGHVGPAERQANASTRTEEHFIQRHGPIKGRRLG